MPDSQTIHVEGIGPVTFVHSARARRTTITIRPRRPVRVAMPHHTSYESAMSFVRVKETWIKKHLAKIREYETQKKDFQEAFLAIDGKEARKKIIRRLKELARQNGFTIRRISIRNQRTRWGSCSGKGDISLNIKLAILPQELFDYVIFHELVHTQIHNHSVKFWQELNRYVENGKAKAAILKEYGLGIL